MVVGAVALLWHYPVAVFVFFSLLFALTFYFLPKIWRSISMNLWFISRKLNQLSGAENIDKLPAKLPSRYEALFRRLTSAAATVAWAVPVFQAKENIWNRTGSVTWWRAMTNLPRSGLSPRR